MSTNTQTTNESNDLPKWEELTAARQRLLRIISRFCGPATIERPELRKEVKSTDADDVEEIIDSKGRILKTLNQCTLLNKLTEEDGYLKKLRQGGGNPIVIDYEYEPERDTRQSTSYGKTNQLETMAFDILDRENEPSWKLDDVDMDDPKEIVSAVNRIVGRQVFGVQSESSQYRLVPEAIPIVEDQTGASEGESSDDNE